MGRNRRKFGKEKSKVRRRIIKQLKKIRRRKNER